jgi:hypothetical protein
VQVDPSLSGWTGEAAFVRGAFAYVDELGRRGNLDELQTRLATVRKRCKVLRTANEVCSFSAHLHIAACCVWGHPMTLSYSTPVNGVAIAGWQTTWLSHPRGDHACTFITRPVNCWSTCVGTQASIAYLLQAQFVSLHSFPCRKRQGASADKQ